MSYRFDRRRFHRFATLPSEGRVTIRRQEEVAFGVEGRVCDISEAGICMRLDEPVDPGTAVAIEIILPWVEAGADGSRAIYVLANVIWADERDVAGPVRTAAAFTRFCCAGDRGRLMRGLVQSGLPQAA